MCCSANQIDNLQNSNGLSVVRHNAVYSGTLIWHIAQICLNFRFNFVNREHCRTILPILWQQQSHYREVLR